MSDTDPKHIPTIEAVGNMRDWISSMFENASSTANSDAPEPWPATVPDLVAIDETALPDVAPTRGISDPLGTKRGEEVWRTFDAATQDQIGFEELDRSRWFRRSRNNTRPPLFSNKVTTLAWTGQEDELADLAVAVPLPTEAKSRGSRLGNFLRKKRTKLALAAAGVALVGAGLFAAFGGFLAEEEQPDMPSTTVENTTTTPTTLPAVISEAPAQSIAAPIAKAPGATRMPAPSIAISIEEKGDTVYDAVQRNLTGSDGYKADQNLIVREVVDQVVFELAQKENADAKKLDVVSVGYRTNVELSPELAAAVHNVRKAYGLPTTA